MEKAENKPHEFMMLELYCLFFVLHFLFCEKYQKLHTFNFTHIYVFLCVGLSRNSLIKQNNAFECEKCERVQKVLHFLASQVTHHSIL